jgi:hypothetical protein
VDVVDVNGAPVSEVWENLRRTLLMVNDEVATRSAMRNVVVVSETGVVEPTSFPFNARWVIIIRVLRLILRKVSDFKNLEGIGSGLRDVMPQLKVFENVVRSLQSNVCMYAAFSRVSIDLVEAVASKTQGLKHLPVLATGWLADLIMLALDCSVELLETLLVMRETSLGCVLASTGSMIEERVVVALQRLLYRLVLLVLNVRVVIRCHELTELGVLHTSRTASECAPGRRIHAVIPVHFRFRMKGVTGVVQGNDGFLTFPQTLVTISATSVNANTMRLASLLVVRDASVETGELLSSC